ncbi:MFS transporter [Sandarakinorhabdus sp. AAP62]|uniref:MFS transporter n=1 Tax=Sandarakinorhabdus sp. AAP62 TaxID=1248916 RepID=UPI0002E5953D|nr:MFS transporter [Sandarakinorhabdus sp. AAP62]
MWQMLDLLTTRRFGPLFATQFLGAFNDNLFRTALVFIVAYDVAAADPKRAALLASAAAGLFILPYFLFSGVAGSLSDARDKAAICRLVKLSEIAFMALGWAALWLGSLPLALAVVFLMGCHSTLFGPVKYAILPQHLKAEELLAGTGMVEAATFVAILLGQVAGGLLATRAVGPVALAIAALGWLASRSIPPAPPEPDRLINWNPISSSRAALGHAFANRRLLIATLAISWFWALGAVYTSQFVPLARNDMGATEEVATIFLAAFSVGIAAGSVAVGRWLKGRISTRLCAAAGLAMALAGLDLWFAIPAAGAAPKDVASFFAAAAGWRVLADLTALALAGGVFSVPLYAVLQTAGEAGARASAIAANNIINSLFQVSAVLAAGAAVGAGLGVPLVLMLSGLTVLLLLPALHRLDRA